MSADHPELSSILQCFQLKIDNLIKPVDTNHLQEISRSHCLKWRSLPSALEMKNPQTVVNDIERKAKSESEMRADLFAEWQSEKGSDATYKLLINALLVINCKQDAEFVCVLVKNTDTNGSLQGDRAAHYGIAKENLARIRGCFTALVKRVSMKLSTMDIDMHGFQLFIGALFPPGNFISKTDTIMDLFCAVTHCKLWDYSYYSPVEEICKEYAREDPELTLYLSQYKADLAGFKATTKIIQYIEECNDEDEIADSEDSISQYKARYDKKYCRRLAIKLQDRVTERSLEYVDKFWMSIADLFLLPSLPVLLEGIHKGCTEITWFISTEAANKIERTVPLFYRLTNIMQVMLDDKILLAEEDEIAKYICKLQTEIQFKNGIISLKNDIIHQLNNELVETKEELNKTRTAIQELLTEKDECESRSTIEELEVHTKEYCLAVMKREVATLRNENKQLNKEMEKVQADSHHRETELRQELKLKEAEISGLMSELKKVQELEVIPDYDLQFTWTQGSDMPFGMSNHIKSVIIQDTLYVGGGNTGWNNLNDYIVMKCDTSSLQWTTLTPYMACDFAMAVLENQLVLVGGNEEDSISEKLGVWSAGNKKWTHPYPDMPTARYSCSVVVYEDWLVIAGGCTESLMDLSSVEILNIDTKQWYEAPSAPRPLVDMKVAIITDTCYFMGGYADGLITDAVYSVNLPSLVFHLNPIDQNISGFFSKDLQIWQEVATLPFDGSSPLSYNDNLLAIGGSKDGNTVSDIHLYRPNTSEWVKVADLPTPRYNCACSVVTDREIIITGGSDDSDVLCQKRTDIAFISASQAFNP